MSYKLKIGDRVKALGNYWDEQLGEYAYTGVQTVIAVREVPNGQLVKVDKEKDDWVHEDWFKKVK